MPKVVHGNRMKIYKVPDVLFRPTLTTKVTMNNDNYTPPNPLTTWIDSIDNSQNNHELQQLMLLLNDHETNHIDNGTNIQEGQSRETSKTISTNNTFNILELAPQETLFQPNVHPISEIEQVLGNNEEVQPSQEYNEKLKLPAEIINELQLLMMYEEIHTNIMEYRKKAVIALINTIKQDNVLQKVCKRNNRMNGVEAILKANNLPKQHSLSPRQTNAYPSPETQNTETRAPPTSQYRNPPGPQLLQSINGIISYRQYDPEFVPVPLESTPRQKRVELGLFFDVTQHLVSQKIAQLELKEEVDTARCILANRIASRLVIILQQLPTESDRQHAIRSYVKTHIHDNFTTDDNQLHILINNYHNAMMEAKSRQD
ncbi:hypothetical protein INT45_009681 [Circinella minor]|uniref:Uncharacterized protein n=1 Tax=Circinella minor TaxID=1195481 RepID=A0A8H7RMH5_9FUNG|nr:hypothetical protein INT45_009681 [Circinella minor]